jgi:hypothetical protein
MQLLPVAEDSEVDSAEVVVEDVDVVAAVAVVAAEDAAERKETRNGSP